MTYVNKNSNVFSPGGGSGGYFSMASIFISLRFFVLFKET